MSTVDLLRTTAPRAPEGLRARVLASRPVERRRRVRPLLVVTAAALLAVAAAVVHGFSTSAPKSERPVTLQTAVAHGGAATESYKATAPRDVVAAPAPGRLTHTDASIRVRVADTDKLGAATNRA